jgi:hypothetical protein
MEYNHLLHLIIDYLDIFEEIKSMLVYLMAMEYNLLPHHFPIHPGMKQKLNLEDNFHLHHCNIR